VLDVTSADTEEHTVVWHRNAHTSHCCFAYVDPLDGAARVALSGEWLGVHTSKLVSCSSPGPLTDLRMSQVVSGLLLDRELIRFTAGSRDARADLGRAVADEAARPHLRPGKPRPAEA
jgi:hypothetical protein